MATKKRGKKAKVFLYREALRALNEAYVHRNYWPAREFVQSFGQYDGDLNGSAVLAEVVRLALGGTADDRPNPSRCR